MSKSSQIKKLVNGEIADADDVNQIVENAGTEGGAIPYDPTSHEQETDGTESLGSTAYPWGSLKINRDAEFVEVDPVSHTVASTVAIKDLRKFITLKDCPTTFVGAAGNVVKVKTDESGLEFGSAANIQTFTSSGTFTVPTGITRVYVSMVGGGGGGATSTDSDIGCGGGGGGGGVLRYPVTVTPAAGITVTIGTSGAAGGAGGASSFGSVSVAGGSAGSTGSNGAGGAGGTGVGGLSSAASAATAGVRGGYLTSVPGGAGAAGADGAGGTARGGGGGGSIYGAGGNANVGGAGTAAAANTGGGGGGGAASGAGGAGGTGLVIVEW